MNVVVVGTGYVGLVSGLGYAKLGHRVACVDVDATKVGKLDLGEAPFFEPGMQELLREMQESGRVLFTTDLTTVLGGAEVIVIAVGTPSKPDGSSDLSYVMAAAETIGKTLDHEALIVMKSTVPVGTNRHVLARVQDAMRATGRDALTSLIAIASVPEFLREGRAIQDFLKPDRIVIGADDSIAYAIVDQLHHGIEAPRITMSLESAELAKYAANAFLATKISFVNEIANIADRTGADVREVVRVLGADPRIGPHFLQPGVGYGGSCFPKDVSALQQMAGVNGYDFKLLSAVIEVNNRQREMFLRRVESTLGGLQGRKIGVWGLAFKGGTDDVRESAALDIVQRLFARGAEVTVFDPRAMANARRHLTDRVEFAPTAIDAATGAEALLVLSEWPEFREVSFPTLRERMLEPRIFDGRNLLSDMRLDTLGFEYYGVGIKRNGVSS